MFPPGINTLRHSLRNFWPSLNERCSKKCDEYSFETLSSGKGRPLLRSQKISQFFVISIVIQPFSPFLFPAPTSMDIGFFYLSMRLISRFDFSYFIKSIAGLTILLMVALIVIAPSFLPSIQWLTTDTSLTENAHFVKLKRYNYSISLDTGYPRSRSSVVLRPDYVWN